MDDTDRNWIENLHLSNYNRTQALRDDLDGLQSLHDSAITNLEAAVRTLQSSTRPVATDRLDALHTALNKALDRLTALEDIRLPANLSAVTELTRRISILEEELPHA